MIYFINFNLNVLILFKTNIYFLFNRFFNFNILHNKFKILYIHILNSKDYYYPINSYSHFKRSTKDMGIKLKIVLPPFYIKLIVREFLYFKISKFFTF